MLIRQVCRVLTMEGSLKAWWKYSENKYDIRGQRTQSPLVRERHPKAEINKSQTGGIWLFIFFLHVFWRRAWPRCCESSCRIVWFWLSCCYGFNRVLPLPAWHCLPCSGGMQTGLSQGSLSLIWRAALQLNLRYQAGFFLVRYLSTFFISGFFYIFYIWIMLLILKSSLIIIISLSLHVVHRADII